MNKLLLSICYFLSSWSCCVSHAAPNLLFNILETGTPASVSITLCLNGTGPLSCQNYTVAALNLRITTTILHHNYPNAGIKINTPGYTLAGLGIHCASTQNGYCLFSVSDTAAQTIYLYPPLGGSYGGGVVACLGGAPYLNLIAASTDSINGIPWGGFGTTTGAQSLIDGAANSTAILNAGISSSAVNLCTGTINGYNDWFLPAIEQLNCLYANQAVLPNVMNAVYWSSTEGDENSAWFEFFDNGNQLSVFKTFYFSVRCVRALPA